MRFLLRPPIPILVLFSSFLFTFFVWLVSVFLSLEAHRIESLSVAHVIVVLRKSAGTHALQSITEKIVQVSGDHSVHVIDPKDILSRISFLPVSAGFKNVWMDRKILSVDITFGKDKKGDPTYLVPQMEAINSLLQNDSNILLVQSNELWGSRLDSLERLVLRIRSVGIILLSLSVLSVVFFWGYAIRGVGLSRSQDGDSDPPRRKSFWMESPDESDALVEKGVSSIHTGLAVGLLSGILSLVLVWSSHSALYPHWADPFLLSAPGKEETGGFLWMGIPLLTGVIGWFSGLLARILPS